MSILIKGIDLPKEGETIFIAIKGKTAIETHKGINVGYHSAIQINRPHGRLKDFDADGIYPIIVDGVYMVKVDDLDKMPTILEAER